jgi:hypothetical protein
MAVIVSGSPLESLSFPRTFTAMAVFHGVVTASSPACGGTGVTAPDTATRAAVVVTDPAGLVTTTSYQPAVEPPAVVV